MGALYYKPPQRGILSSPPGGQRRDLSLGWGRRQKAGQAELRTAVAGICVTRLASGDSGVTVLTAGAARGPLALPQPLAVTAAARARL